MLDFHYTDDTGVSIPFGYEIITRSESVWSAKYQKYVKKALFIKNEIMQDKLHILHHNKLKLKKRISAPLQCRTPKRGCETKFTGV